MSSREMIRFKWNHRHRIHRAAVKRANRLLARVPFAWNYAVTARRRQAKLPYSLVGPGDVVVQIGAPSDTLLSGRSRGMHLAIRSAGGRAIIVEPDPTSAAEFRARAEELGLDHVEVVNAGAWSEHGTLVLRVDPSHPATNFVEGTVDYDEGRLADFARVEVPVRSLDEIVTDIVGHTDSLRLVSITTNNSEREILRGMQRILDGGLRYLCLARTGDGYGELVAGLGFDQLGLDDRGFTFVRRN